MNEGKFVRIYLKNGHVFFGVVQSWSNESGIVLKGAQGEIIELPFYNDISAIIYLTKKDGSFLKESKVNEMHPESSPEETDIDRAASLVELHKMKADAERESVRSKLRTPVCTGETVQYGSTISMLREFANNTNRQGKRKKE